LVNTSTFKQSRLTIDSFKEISSNVAPCSPTKKSPQVVARKLRLFRFASAKDEWKKNRNTYPHKSSNVGKKYQALHIPEPNDFRKDRTDSDVLYELLYDPKHPPDTLPFMQQLSSGQVIWTDNQRKKFHLFMVRSMKNISCVNKMLGNIGVSNCLDYYYGVYKRTKEYELLKELCPKHFVEDVLCGICRKPKAVIACDTCTDAYHLGCLTPPLLEIPQVEHFECNICLKEKKAESSAMKVIADVLIDKSNSSSAEEGSSTSSNNSGSSKSIFLSRCIEDKSNDLNKARRSSRPRFKSHKVTEQCPTSPTSRVKSVLETLPKTYATRVGWRSKSRSTPDKHSSSLKDTSNSAEISTEDAKLGAPISISAKNSLAFYEKLQVLNPIAGANPRLWTIRVGHTVSLATESSERKDDATSPLGIAQVTAMWREVSKDETCELRRYMQPKLSGCGEDTTFSEIVDKQKISIEIRWFYRRSEIPDFDNLDSTANSSTSYKNELEEVYETDHMDVFDLSCVSRSVKIESDEVASNASSSNQPNVLPSVTLYCKRFYFVVRKKLSPPPKYLGDSQILRALNFSRIMKQSPNLKALIVDRLKKKVERCSVITNL
jgi:hypothetical protein